MHDISDILTHYGEDRKRYFSAVSPPIIQTSNFMFDSVEEFRMNILNEEHAHVYTRGNNPTVEILCKKLAALEHTEKALVTSSGAAAIACAVTAHVSGGDHVVCVRKPYSWTHRLISDLLSRFGVTVTYVDGRNTQEIMDAIKDNTTLLYLESPNSHTFELQDLDACASLAKKQGITTVIDNSYASPYYQNPTDFGIDIIVHSGTKYINGHSDVVNGVICGSTESISRIFHGPYMTYGVNISPHDAWLIIRGMRTLQVRMERSSKTALQLIQFLKNHPKVERIIYPYLPDSPQYNLAKKQMRGCGGLFTAVFNADKKEDIIRFSQKLQRFLMAVSWGGHESLIMPSVVFHDVPGKEDSPVPWNYIRFYIGLESYEYLKSDLESALACL